MAESNAERHDTPAHFPNTAFDVVALAASAGGLTALSKVLSALPVDFPAALVVVQHVDPRRRSLMAEILSRRTPLRVKQGKIISTRRRSISLRPTGTCWSTPTALCPSPNQNWSTLCTPPPTRCLKRWRPVTETGLSPWSSRAQAAMATWGCKRSKRGVVP